jgi:hypothetical protein
MGVFFPAFIPDSRGNSLETYVVRRVASTSGRRRLYLCGPQEVSTQLWWLLQRCGRNPRELPLRERDRAEWSHRIEFDGDLPAEVESALELLKRVVSIPVREPLDIALTLDFYKAPDPDIDPMKWPNTPAGELVHKSKYHQSAVARTALAAELARVVDEHPLYKLADYVLPVPGHDARELSCGVDLARRVASAAEIPLIKVATARAQRPQAKEQVKGEQNDLSDEFSIADDLTDKVVLIIDDVYRSGQSMHAVATVAKSVGARRVLGLSGARTLKGR